MGQVKKIVITFIITHVGLVLAIYSLFTRSETLFIFGAVTDYAFRMWFIWLLSVPPGTETGEERGIRLFGFSLTAVVLALIFLIIGFLLNRFYF